jgi:hypothetical protein
MSSFWESMFDSIILEHYPLNDKVNRDASTVNEMVAVAEIPNDLRYGIFTLTKTADNAIFVSKSNPASFAC